VRLLHAAMVMMLLLLMLMVRMLLLLLLLRVLLLLLLMVMMRHGRRRRRVVRELLVVGSLHLQVVPAQVHGPVPHRRVRLALLHGRRHGQPRSLGDERAERE
jgi:hypothetical protein